jgi:hypothetical protein
VTRDPPTDRASCAERRAAWLSGTTLAEREHALRIVIRRQMELPFDLEREPDVIDPDNRPVSDVAADPDYL